jgi:hypothetical protein
MRDLANERDAVVSRLRQFNFEPVNAEGLLPDGTSSWDRLEPEIRSSDVFVLLLGESYGWIPSSGPRAGEFKSVTELEFDVARDAGLPILVFMQRLQHGAPPDERRDDFRRRLGAWDGGYFRTEFDLASDLAEKVGRALVELITEGFRKADRPPTPSPPPDADIVLPDALVESVANRSAILFLGAGASLQAGMPSAAAFIQAMIDRIQAIDPKYRLGFSGTAFNAVASDFESVLGPERLHELAQQLVNPESLGAPTEAHHIASRLFDVVLTTNYDLLVERALEGRTVDVVAGEGDLSADPSAVHLVKLHGSISEPQGMVLTESDLADFERSRPRLWASVQALLRAHPILIVGSSLRDPSIIRLFESCRPDMYGWAVLYDPNEAERRRVARWGLGVVQGNADSVLAALERKIRLLSGSE